MSKRVLPSLCVLAIVGEVVHDELVDVGEREHPLRGVPQGHGGESNVRVGWFAVPIRLPARPWHLLSYQPSLDDIKKVPHSSRHQ